MSVEVHCLTCHHRALHNADGTVQDVLMQGGSRKPAVHASLSAWAVWRRVRAGGLGPVVGRCPHCDQPLVADGDGLPPLTTWTLGSPKGDVQIDGDALSGPSGPMNDEQVTAFLDDQLAPRWTDSLRDPGLPFVGVMMAIIAGVAVFWIGAIAYLINFFGAMATQGDFSGPFGG